MFILARALAYATAFVGILLVFLPARLLVWTGVHAPSSIGVAQVAGAIITLVGAALAVLCVLTFAITGRGTPAPFDPPRRLVRAGPYRVVRNPMYIGAALALTGAAIFYRSLALLLYALTFLGVAHLFVTLYEEPHLAQLFPAEYLAYRKRVRRWLPTWRRPAA